MSFWNTLLSALSDLEGNSSSTKRRAQRRSARREEEAGNVPGDILSGKVDYVGGKFAKIVSGGLNVVVFRAEMANEYVSNPASILSVGQDTDFVLLEKNDKGWIVSIRATVEARAREALASVQVGDRIKGPVLKLTDSGVVMDAGQFEAWVPITELSWYWVDYPSEVVAIGEKVEAEIVRVEMPEGWLKDRRKRRAKAVASLRACESQPVSRSIPVAYSGLPFKVWAVAKTPRDCDAVAIFVLEELVEQQSVDSISRITGFSPATLENVRDLLADQSLVDAWVPNERGKNLVQAIVHARELNNDPIRGIFASAAHSASQLISAQEHRQQATYPRDWPRPVFDKRLEDHFAKATDEALPEPLLERLVPDDKRWLLAKLQEDDRLRVFLRRDGGRPWKPVYVETPESWLLAGLWSAFYPFDEKLYRPRAAHDQCQNYLMIRCQVVDEDHGNSDHKTVFFEPYTATLWCLRDENRAKILNRKGNVFPPLPMLKQKVTDEDASAASQKLQADSWCIVQVR